MQQPKDDKTRTPSDLYAVSISDTASTYDEQADDDSLYAIPTLPFLQSFVLPVLSTSLLITSNTVGATMLVLPELAAGPGMGVSSAIFVGAYIMNLISGLAIAQVAIQQHETSGSDVPSSFKEFAEANLKSATHLVSGISVLVNVLILAFDTTKAGQVVGSTLVGTGVVVGLAPSDNLMSYLWAAGLIAIVSTQSLKNLSQVASLLVMGLFASLACLLLPGLANVADPMTVLTAAPDASVDDLMSTVVHMTPILVSSLVFQNIVPTVTRILEYDRLKITTAVTLGSLMPLGMYLAWCLVALGGGFDTMGTAAGPLLTIFSLVTVAGSSIGALMSLSGEFESLLGDEKTDTFSLPSVILPAVMSLLACEFFASDINGALELAGSYGSPILYGLMPVAMAWTQLQNQQKGGTSAGGATTTSTSSVVSWQEPPSSVVPGGTVGLGVLGLGAGALVCVELAETVSQLLLQ
jgi:tyrosine-specific transport protein